MIERNPIISNIIAEIVKDAYAKSYRVRSVGPGSLEVTIPRAIVEREARKWGLSIEEFIKVFQIEYLFDNFGGAFLRFKKESSEDEEEFRAQEK
ncbi:hypothetical protein ES703_111015 [subsurface metagenome]